MLFVIVAKRPDTCYRPCFVFTLFRNTSKPVKSRTCGWIIESKSLRWAQGRHSLFLFALRTTPVSDNTQNYGVVVRPVFARQISIYHALLTLYTSLICLSTFEKHMTILTRLNIFNFVKSIDDRVRPTSSRPREKSFSV